MLAASTTARFPRNHPIENEVNSSLSTVVSDPMGLFIVDLPQFTFTQMLYLATNAKHNLVVSHHWHVNAMRMGKGKIRIHMFWYRSSGQKLGEIDTYKIPGTIFLVESF